MIDILEASVDEIFEACTQIVPRRSRVSGLGALGEDALLNEKETTGVAAAIRLVDGTDRAAVERQRRTADAQRKLAARTALRLVLAHRLGAEARHAGDLDIVRTCRRCLQDHGKPRLPGGELALSSSASGRRILVAVGEPDTDVGVDIERIPADLHEGFDDYALSPLEKRLLPSGAEGTRTRIGSWVAKEAVLKSTGLGLDYPPWGLTISQLREGALPGGSGEAARSRWGTVLEAQTPTAPGAGVMLLPTAGGYLGAVAAGRIQSLRQVRVSEIAA